MASPAAISKIQLLINKVDVIKSTSKDAEVQTLASALSEAMDWIIASHNETINLNSEIKLLHKEIKHIRPQ